LGGKSICAARCEEKYTKRWMGKKVRVTRVIDVTELGRAGGLATAAGRNAEQRKAAARAAITARWDAYYKLHPYKLNVKKKGVAKKGKATE
jgi:hypothetical protein